MFRARPKSKEEPEKCSQLHYRCTQEHACNNCPVGAQTIALNEQFKHFGFSDSWYTYCPSAAAFIAQHNLCQRDLVEIRESHIARPFRQHTSLTLGFVPERNIGFLFDWQKNTFITLFSCTKQQYETYFSEPVECDFDPNIALLSEEQTPTKELSPTPESKPEDEPPPAQPPAIYSPPPTVIAPGTSLTPPEPRPPKPPAPQIKPGLVILGHTARGLGLACAGILHQIVMRGLGKGLSGLTISGLVEKADLAKNNLDSFDSDLSRRIHFVDGSVKLKHDHQMDKVVPSKDWPTIKELARTILQYGKEGIPGDGGCYRVKYSYVNEHPVVVTYGINEEGVYKCTGILVPLNPNKFIPTGDI